MSKPRGRTPKTNAERFRVIRVDGEAHALLVELRMITGRSMTELASDAIRAKHERINRDEKR